MTKAIVALLFLGLNFYVYQFMATNEVIPTREEFVTFPTTVGDWACPGQREMDPKAAKFLGATDYVICTYYKNEQSAGSRGQSPRHPGVELYVGYHASQVRKEGGGGNANAIHPPEHCLPGSGWDIIDSKKVPISFTGLPEGRGLREEARRAKRFVIAHGEARELVYFWYQGQGRVITANEDVILFRFWNRATSGRTDGSLVRFTTPIERGDVEAAEARFEEFASVIVPVLPGYVPD
jgi:EpsI family protein